ncbi:MAG TPA: ABC transporter ATP-binding protein/permease [Veillonellaceae bacterium]|nr:ABC transporter ATP-binding protein/permease [Veillonellaceae bacterium]
MKTLFHFLKPYRMLCVLTLLVMLMEVTGTLYIPTLVADMINIGVGSKDMDYVLDKGAIMLVTAILTETGALLGVFLCARLSSRLSRDIRNALYDKSLSFSAYDFEHFGTSSMITRTLTDVSVVQQAFVWSVQMILPVPAICLLGVIMSFSINRHMGLLMVFVTAVILAGAFFITRSASSIFEKMQGFLDRINEILRENITGVRVIRAFNKERYEEHRMRRSFEDYAAAAIRANGLFFALESMAIFIMNVSIVAILWLGSNQVGTGGMEIGDITAVTEYAILILFYIIMAQMVIILLPRANVCMKRISAVLSHEPEITDGRKSLSPSYSQEICRFDDVDFQFPGADEATLTGLSFSIRRGETTAIIGSTGSGKSTIAKLLLRFHDVTKGSITVDGEDIRSITQEALRSRISYVPQASWLFSGTIASNLRYGCENASEEDMRRALMLAQAGFVFDLPEGLSAPVSQGGTNFSGGQRQRLAIARALMKKADLYIFDDSFSALDFKTDAALRHALSREMKDSAVLIIAQRVNTIAHADQIIVLEHGRTVGIGRHEELLRTCPVYRTIVESQTKGGGLHGL